jgi:hypothetical protein
MTLLVHQVFVLVLVYDYLHPAISKKRLWY